MTYRNKKTREVIVTTNRITGKNWELVEDTAPENGAELHAAEEADEEDTEEATEEATEETEEQPVVEEKPKRSRRSKK